MTLSMPNTRKVIHKQDAVTAKLRQEVRSAGLTSWRKKKAAILKAASGRPCDLAERARESLENRRAKAMVERLQGGGE